MCAGRIMARLIVEQGVLMIIALVRSAKRSLPKAHVLERGLLTRIVAAEHSPYQRAG